MEIQEFAQEVKTALLGELGEGYQVEYTVQGKNNGVAVHGLMVKEKDRNVGPVIYMEGFLKDHEAGMPMQEVLRHVAGICRKAVPGQDVDMDSFLSFDRMKDRICYRLVGRDANRELLQDIPHVEYLDMAICFFYACQELVSGGGSILVKKNMMEAWGTDREELMGLAMGNTPRLFPWECVPMDDILAGIMGEGCSPGDFPHSSMRILTNRQGLNGASCVLYPGVLEQLAWETGCGFFILPSSIHEVILLPDTGADDCQVLKDIIGKVNTSEVAPEEILTGSLYRYDPGKKEMEKVL